jgi:hypothetical protein
MADRESTTSPGDGAVRDGDDQGPDRVDEQEDESFPASDPHSDWAGGTPDLGDERV